MPIFKPSKKPGRKENAMAPSDASTADREIVIERTVNAPRELV
jgi:hypothetical protein